MLDQLVGEGVAVGFVGLTQHGGRDRGVAAVDDRCLADAGHCGEHPDVEVAADHRGKREEPLGLGAETSNATADHLLDAHRQSDRQQIHFRDPPAGVVLDQGTRLGEMT